MYTFIGFSIVFGLLYWLIDNNYRDCRKYLHDCLHSKFVLSIIKWISVAILIGISIDFRHYLCLLKSVVLLCYSIGDVIIVWKETYSIIFFFIGHILLIVHAIIKDMWHFLIEGHPYMFAWIGGALVICIVFSFILRKNRKDITNSEFFIYIFYIFALGLILLLPIILSHYCGTVLFVISDILLGFKFTSFKKLTFPLYLASLVLILTHI